MNRKTAAGFLGTVFGMILATATQAACPPLPPPAALAAWQRAENGARDLFEYAVLRLLKCDWDDALPAFDVALEASHLPGQSDLQGNILRTGAFDPVPIVVSYAKWSRDREGWLLPLRLRDDEIDAATRPGSKPPSRASSPGCRRVLTIRCGHRWTGWQSSSAPWTTSVVARSGAGAIASTVLHRCNRT